MTAAIASNQLSKSVAFAESQTELLYDEHALVAAVT